MALSETTPLTGATNPKLSFLIRRRTRQFQCCVSAILIAIIITLLVIITPYYINDDNEDIDNAIQNGVNALNSRDEVEKNMTILQTSSPSYRHQMSTATNLLADKIARSGYATYHASKWMLKRMNNSDVSKIPCSKDALKQIGWCMDYQIKCSQSRYRSINGSCNSLNNSQNWGVAFTKFRRLMKPQYADGVGAPREGIQNNQLPSASTVSNLVHRPVYKNDPNFTVMLAVWGQFIDHDITATALSRGKNGEAISCCNAKSQHPECFPVREIQSNGDIHCTDFIRSAPASTCCLGHREQLNQVSAYLDGSSVYGSEQKLASTLRTFKNGTLAMLTTVKGRQLLPVSNDSKDGCNREDMIKKNRYCFVSGDARANENLHLTTMHLLWARQHNRIAGILGKMHPNWTDEKIYQESRHIVAAQIQHITYFEFLPIVLGYEVVIKNDLLPNEKGYYYGYNASTDASIANEFAAVAFRFAHTLIPGLIRNLQNNSVRDEYIRLHEILFDPFALYDDELDNILKGAMKTPIEAADPYFTDELKFHLFERKNEKKTKNACGLDLVALNIQRARDHGLPGYLKWRQYCNLSIPQKFDDMKDYIDDESVQIMSKLYSNIDDIDPYTGAISEKPLNGSLVGPTVSCIITDQFLRLKTGDRYWYETPEQPQAFTPDQLKEIRQATLASIICENSDALETIPVWVMRSLNSSDNNITSCANIKKTNLSYW